MYELIVMRSFAFWPLKKRKKRITKKKVAVSTQPITSFLPESQPPCLLLDDDNMKNAETSKPTYKICC